MGWVRPEVESKKVDLAVHYELEPRIDKFDPVAHTVVSVGARASAVATAYTQVRRVARLAHGSQMTATAPASRIMPGASCPMPGSWVLVHDLGVAGAIPLVRGPGIIDAGGWKGERPRKPIRHPVSLKDTRRVGQALSWCASLLDILYQIPRL